MPNINSVWKNPIVIVSLFAFVLLTVWWFILGPFLQTESLQHAKYIWGSSYQILAILGGLVGFFQAKHWGGTKSLLGRTILVFSIGLLLQAVGQSVYSYYNLFAGVEAPYPSLGDIGFFGSVIFYIIGAFLLSKLAGVKVNLKSFFSKIQALLIPLIMLGMSYFMFLSNYEFDLADKLKVFLDFGYPLGQAFYVSIAVLTLILSRKVLGGLMKMPIVLFLMALIIQYISDFNFLYQAHNSNWFVGGFGDFLYMFSYLFMTISILNLSNVFSSIKNS